jgi:hypothetical protein
MVKLVTHGAAATPSLLLAFSANIMECLQTCAQLLKKKLKSGTPTGDILDAVIAGNDGPINEKAKADLAKLQSLAMKKRNMTKKKPTLINISYGCQELFKKTISCHSAFMNLAIREKVAYIEIS